jgi:hypothetical protein
MRSVRQLEDMVTRGRPLTVLGVTAGYVTVGVLLYRQRVVSVAQVWDSDLLIFALPAAIAFVTLTKVLWPTGALRASGRFPRARAIALAGLVTAVSMWVCLVIAFNLYGT